MQISNISRGVIFMFASSFGFALMNAFAKILSTNIPAMENIFFRSIVMVIIMLFIYVYISIRNKNKKRLKKGGFIKLFMRVAFGSFAMFCVFYNIATIPLGTATAFAQSVPIYVVFIGFFFLKEKVSIAIICATLIGFIGILMIGNPSINGLSIANILCGIASGIGMAIAFVALKGLKDYFDNSFVILSFALGTTILGLFGMLIPIENVGGFVMPTNIEWFFILCMGISGTIAQHFLNKAYVIAPVGIVAPIDYSRIIFSIFLGILLGDSIPNLTTSIGIALIIFSGLLIATPALLKDLKKIKTKNANI